MTCGANTKSELAQDLALHSNNERFRYYETKTGRLQVLLAPIQHSFNPYT